MNRQSTLHTVGDAGLHRSAGFHRLGTVFDWTLSVSGAVEHPVRLSLSDLWRLPGGELDLDVHCVSSGRGIYTASGVSGGSSDRSAARSPAGPAARFAGVFFEEIARLVRPARDARSVLFISRAPGQAGPRHARHETPLELDLCLAPRQVLLAGLIDGRPLAYRNGGPLRSIVDGRGFDGEGRYFYKSLKWLEEICFLPLPVEECLRGTWERAAGYSVRGNIRGAKIQAFMAEAAGEDLPRWVPPSEHPAFWEALIRGQDLSALICGRLQACLPGFQAHRGWHGGLRFSITSHDPASGRQTVLRACQMRGTRFDGFDFAGRSSEGRWDFSHVNFSLSHFDRAVLGGAPASASVLRGCDFEGASFRQADLRQADLTHAYLASAALSEAKLDGARLTGAYLGRATFKDADLSEVDARGADFTDADLRRARSVRGLWVEGAMGFSGDMAAWLTRQGARGAEARPGVMRQDPEYAPFWEVSVGPAEAARAALPTLQRSLPDLIAVERPIQGVELPGEEDRHVLQLAVPAHQRESLAHAITRIEGGGLPLQATAGQLIWRSVPAG